MRQEAQASGLATLDGATLPTEHGHADLPSGQSANIRVTRRRCMNPSAAPSSSTRETEVAPIP